MDIIRLSTNEAKMIETIGKSSISMSVNEEQVLENRLAIIREQVINALDFTGWVLINGLSGDPESSTRGLATIVGTLGVAVDEIDAGPLVMDITPEGFFIDKISSRSTTTFDIHTDLAYVKDPPDLITVLCVQPDVEGNGRTIISDLWSCIDELSPQTLEILMSPEFNFVVPPRCRDGVLESIPILTKDRKGKFSIRIRFDTVTTKYKAGVNAVQDLRQVLENNQIEFLLEQHYAYVIDNKRMVHGRTVFRKQNGSKERKLKRIYGKRRYA